MLITLDFRKNTMVLPSVLPGKFIMTTGSSLK